MTVDSVAGLERKKGADAHHHGAQRFVPNVEVVMREAGSLPQDDAVIRIVGRVLRRQRTEGGALFHALKVKGCEQEYVM
jgi:hypothetical protein